MAAIPIPPTAPSPSRPRRNETVPKLRPGQAVSLADVGWALPVDRKRRAAPTKGPSGRSF